MKKLLVVVFAAFFLFGCSSSSSSTSNVCKTGDIVKVDFVGKVNGVAFNGGTASGAIIELGAGGYIDGFEDGITGMKIGEQKTITVTFPTNYSSESLAGQKATFDIALRKIYRSVN